MPNGVFGLGSGAGQIDIQFVVRNVQEAVRSLQSVERELRELGRVTGLTGEGFLGLEKGFKRFRVEAENFAKLLRAEFRWILGFEIIRGLENIVRTSIGALLDYDQALAKVRAATLASEEEMKVLGEAILDVAKSSVFSFYSIGEAAAVIARAGLTAKETAYLLKAASDLAMASGEDLAKTASFLVSVMKGYGIEAKKMYEVADLMAVGLNKSKLALKDMIIAWQYVAPVARQTGESIKDLIAYMMVLSDKGLEASKIGTSLRQVYTYLLAPTGKMRRMFETLGITFDDLNLRQKALVDVLEDLRKKGFGAIEAYQALGIRGATAFAYLLQSIEDVRKAQKELTDVGALQKMSRAIKESVINQFAILRNEIKATVAEARGVFAPALITTARSISESFRLLVETIQSAFGAPLFTTAGIAGIVTALGGFNARLLAVIGSVGLLISALQGLGRHFGILHSNIISTTDAMYALIGAITAFMTRGSFFLRTISLIGLAITYLLTKTKEFTDKITEPFSGENERRIMEFGRNLTTVLSVKTTKDISNAIGSLMSLRLVLKDTFDLRQYGNLREFYRLLTVYLKAQTEEAAQDLLNFIKSNRENILREYIKILEDMRRERIRRIERAERMLPEVRGGLWEFFTRRREMEARISKWKTELQVLDSVIKAIKEVIENEKRLGEVSEESVSLEKERIRTIGELLRLLRESAEESLALSERTLPAISQNIKRTEEDIFATIVSFLRSHSTLYEKAGEDIDKILEKVKTLKDLSEITILPIPETKKVELIELLEPLIEQRLRLLRLYEETKKRLDELRLSYQEMIRVPITNVEQLRRIWQTIVQMEEISGEILIENRAKFQQLVREFIQDNNLTLSQIQRLITFLARIGMDTSRYYDAIRESFVRYIREGITTIGDILLLLEDIQRSKPLVDILFPDRGRLFDFIITRFREFWAEGRVGTRQLQDLMERLKRTFPTEESEKFINILKETSAINFDVAIRNTQILERVLKDTSISGKYLANSFERAVKTSKGFRDMSNLIRLVNENLTELNERGLSIIDIFTRLLERIRELREEGRITAREHVRLLEQALLMLPTEESYEYYLRFLQERGRALIQARQYLLRQAVFGTIPQEREQAARDFEEIKRTSDEMIQSLIRAAEEGKIYWKDLFEVLRRLGPEGNRIIEQITQQTPKIQMLAMVLRDAFDEAIGDTVSHLEVMHNVFVNMIDRMKNYFADTFVAIMKGEIEDLDDLWRSFIVDIVTMWQEALAKMLVYRLATWLAPQGFGAFIGQLFGITAAKGGILPGNFIPLKQFAYGGIVEKPTLGLIGEGKPEAVVPLPNGKAIPVEIIGQEKMASQPIQIVNVLDPKLVGEYLATPVGQKMVLNVISNQASKVRKILLSR